MHIFKKLTMYSMALMATLTICNCSTLASAKHTHHHIRIVKVEPRHKYRKHVIKHNRKHYKRARYLSFKQMTYYIDSDKYLLHPRCKNLVLYNLRHNAHRYTHFQLLWLVQDLMAKSPSLRTKALHVMHPTYNPSAHSHFLLTSTSHISKLAKQDTAFDTELRADLIKDINRTRLHYNRKPLKVTSLAQATANYRAPKVQYAYENPLGCLRYEHISPKELKEDNGTTGKWVHGLDTHTDGYRYLEHHGYPAQSLCWGENATDWFRTTHGGNPDHTRDKYPDTTPKNIAYNINDAFVNHDDTNGNNDGHRFNELNPSSQYLGVSITYNPATQMGSANEQFIGQ